MKRVALLVCLIAGLFVMSPSAHAQYRQGDMLLSGGLAAGVIGYGMYNVGFPPVTANLEYSVDDRFAFGPYIGFFTVNYKTYHAKANSTVFSIGARGTFHATSSLNEWFNWSIDENKWDIYATGILGFDIQSGRVTTYNNATLEPIEGKDNGFRFAVGPVIGGRYFFSPKLSVYAESGRGAVGLFTIGVSTFL